MLCLSQCRRSRALVTRYLIGAHREVHGPNLFHVARPYNDFMPPPPFGVSRDFTETHLETIGALLGWVAVEEEGRHVGA